MADDALPNVYACGDVAETKTPNPNSRAAMRQAEVAADNVISATRNKTPRFTYTPEWANGVIKLTLGLVGAVLSRCTFQKTTSADLTLSIGPIHHTLGRRQDRTADAGRGERPGTHVRWLVDSAGRKAL